MESNIPIRETLWIKSSSFRLFSNCRKVKFALYLFLTLSFVLNANKSYADVYPTGNTISWDQCKHAIRWDWGILRIHTTDDNDKLESATLSYRANDNSWKTLITIHAAAGSPILFSNIDGTNYGVTAIHADFDVIETNVSPNTHDIHADYYSTGDATFHCFKLPSDILINNGSIELKQDIKWNNRGGGPDALNSIPYTNTLALQTISAPQGLVASQNNCNTVDLTWNMPFQNWQLNTTCTNYGSYSTEIYRNGARIASNITGTSYTDNTALNPGTNYTYTAKTLWTPYENTSTDGIVSSFSNAAIGKWKDVPNQVPDFNASDDRCDGSVKLNWNWYSQNPSNFYIERNGVPIATLTGDIRTHTITSLVRGITDTFSIRARNECSQYSAYSTDNGISIADPALATSILATYNTSTEAVNVTWTDNAANETKYQIVRQDDLGNTVYFDLNPNATSFTDDGVSTCRVYNYKVKVFNECVSGGLISAAADTALIPPPNLHTTFDATHRLVGSKGYFTNRIELSWSVNNAENLEQVKIYRKILGTTDSVLITAQNPSSGLYIDLTADARVYYEYTIVGEKNCNGDILTSNHSRSVGFRNPMGTLSGHVEYTGGIAVADAKIVAEASSGDAGNALDFTGGSATCTDQPSLEPGAGLRMDFWINPSNTAAGNVLSKSGAYAITKNTSGYAIAITTTDGTYSVTIPNASVNAANWNGISIQYDGSVLAAYINGAIIDSTPASGTIIDNANNLVIAGGTHHFKFDEFRMMNIAADSATTVKDYSRYMNGNEVGFKLYLHFDEGVGTASYDVSKAGNVYNANHVQLAGSYSWTSNRPSSAQLGYVTYTNSLGNYVISGIRYNGFGDNYTVIPSKGVHSFAPNSRSVYIGDLSQVFNNQDFEDISSFQVTGSVKYGIPFGDTLSCFVPGVNLLIDGLPVIKNGVPVKTDASGFFDIRVPIGEHQVGVEKFQHVFTDSITPTLDFQQPMTGLLFIDTTTRLVVGRVVGGNVEAGKAPGMGRSNNNIGQAKVRFATPIVGAPCYNPEVFTDINTGEYSIKLPPMQFKVDTAYVLNSGIIPAINPGNLTNGTATLNLTNFSQPIKETDTLYDALGGVLSIDSIEYTKELNFIYRTASIVALTDTLGGRFDGEDSLYMNGLGIQITPPTGTNLWSEFNWPVLLQGKKYHCDITAIEKYTNFDNNVTDTVRLSGSILISNDLINGSDPNGNLALINGKARYSFIAGDPNNSTDAEPAFNYTKIMQVQVIPTGAATVRWNPNITSYPLNPAYRAFILGTKVTGTGIATLGPEKVDYILRDPAGSESSATWTSGHAMTSTSTFKKNSSSSQNVSTTINLGFEQSVGIGVQVPINITVENNIGLSATAVKGLGGVFAESITSSNSVSTRDDADHVGADADIFIGRSRNWLVGPTNNIELVDQAMCSTVLCFGNAVGGLRIAKKLGYAVQPSTVKTRFSYTQSEIENVVIPTLEALRATKLTNTSLYSTMVPSSDPKFGSNNDDPVWAGSGQTTTSPFVYDAADANGPSYHFLGSSPDQDSVRIINQQIALWKQALARNEREKWEAVNNTGNSLLIDNFTLGSAIVSNSYEVNSTQEYTEEWELILSNSVITNISAEAGGTGGGVELSLAFEETKGGSFGTSASNTTSFEYTLTDGDDGDIFSIDVYKSSTGNVFVTRGGRSMCPYEDAVQPHYFDPANPNNPITSHSFIANPTATIQLATIQREIPNISITPSTQFNIPSNQSANYQLILTNQSPEVVNNDIDMRVRIASQSNPHGAIVKIDGLDPNTYYTIPAGAAVVKTLTVERGPIYTDYDSLMVIFSSACSEDIADTAYISVHFIPTCTELALINPNNNWIINNNNQNMLNVGISDYNYNYGAATIIDTVPNPDDTLYLGLNKIGFEMKPSNSSVWMQIEQFLKYPGITDSIIPNNSVSTLYPWDVSQIPDGNYELRAKSYCLNFDGSYSTINSPVFEGIMDRVYPHPFGTPSPGDGILDPNDDIAIQFNEPLELGSINWDNFQVRGVLNGSTLRHSEFINFDGVNDYAEVPGGVGLQTKSFTVEFWARQTGTGTEQTIVSQGIDPNEALSIGFDASGKMKFQMNGISKLSNNTLTGLNQWNHYAAVYDYELNEVYLYQNGVILNTGNVAFSVNFHGTNKLYFGKQMPQNSNYFQGHLHEVRIWNKTLSSGELTQNMNIVLNGSSAGLVHNWQMDEAQGIISKDKIRERNAVMHGASWSVAPNGFSGEFNGTSGYVSIDATTIPVTKNMDATLEFWFNSSQATAATLFSSGKGDGLGGDSLVGWEINKDLAGKIHVLHHGLDFIATDSNYFDGNWHHFALVLNKNANLTAFIDGLQQHSVQSIGFGELSGSFYTLGARGFIQSGGLYLQDNYFQGRIDEFRLWNASRKTEQVKRDMTHRMQGDEYSLLAHIPFETYTSVMGVPTLTASVFNNVNTYPTATASASGGAITSNQTPVLKLPRPVENVNFTWSLNNDKIIITPTTSQELLEHQTIDITVKDVYDLQANQMQSPKTWIAYFNKNQVYWEDDVLDFEIEVDSNLQFTGTILNTGGAMKQYSLSDLPSWLTADISSGNIAPNSSVVVHFTLQDGLNVGQYYADIALTTDFNYNEILRVGLNVKGNAPDWTVNPADFQYTMSVIGEIKLDGVLNGNPETMITGFMHDSVVAVGNLEYVPGYDRYEVFLNLYSNQQIGDSVLFKIYDANTGSLYPIVTPSIFFTEGEVLGTISAPVTFEASMILEQKIPLLAGWTWISLPLLSEKQGSSNELFEALNSAEGDLSLSQSSYDQYDPTVNWIGNLTQTGGYRNVASYRVKKQFADTLILLGSRIHPDSSYAAINLVPGWNWIGFMSTKNLPLQEALGNYNAQDGDLIKSQYEFSIYDGFSNTWNGTLHTMRPGLGYVMKTTTASSFHYPLAAYLRSGEVVNPAPFFELNVGKYEKTMNMIANTNMCTEQLSTPEMVLGAFDETDELRGYAFPQLSDDGENYLFFMTLYGNIEDEMLSLKFFNNSNGLKIPTENTIRISENALVGSLNEPYAIVLDEQNSCSGFDNSLGLTSVEESLFTISPNPFSNSFSVNLPAKFTGKIELVDVLGRIIYEETIANTSHYEWQNKANIQLTNGAYYVRFTSNDEVIYQKKVIKYSFTK